MDQHRLARRATIRRLWGAFIVVLVVVVGVQLAIPMEGHFGIDGSFGFHAWFGFLACAAMIVAAKLLGAILKRGDAYYDDDD